MSDKSKERFYVQCGVYNFKLSASAQCVYFYSFMSHPLEQRYKPFSL